MSKWVLSCWLLCASAQAQGLSVQTVVTEARANNPSLKAAMLQLESARWDLAGSLAEYDPVVGATASAQQNATSNVFGGGNGGAVRINRIRRVDYGASISKHLIWGGDLTLSLSSYAQWSRFSGGFGLSPTMSGMAGVGGVGGIISAFGNFGPVFNLTAKLQLKQPLWRGRGRDVGEANRRSAKLTRDQSEHTRDRVSSELLRDVLTAYWELWYADSTVLIQQQAREVASRQRDEADARSRSGSLAPAEVLTFETQVATSDQDVLNAQVDREARVHELARLIGGGSLSFDELGDEPPAGGGYARTSLEQRAVADSLEVREKLAAVELARLQQKTADDPKKPQLDLDTYVQTQGVGLKSDSNGAGEAYRDSARQFSNGDVLSGFVGLTFSSPVNDRVRRAEMAKARIATDVAEQQLRETRDRVLSEVRGALDREAAGTQKVELAQRTVDIAERQLAAEQARYASGSTTPIAVAEAQNGVRTAKLRLARARADWAESALILDHLSGDLLARYAR